MLGVCLRESGLRNEVKVMNQIQYLQKQVSDVLDTDLDIKYQIAVSLVNYIQMLNENRQKPLLLR